MKRTFKIVAESKGNQFLKVPLNKLVNQLGRYMYKRLDGALSFKTSVNQCEIITMVLYQNKLEDRTGNSIDDEMKEMHLNINITTYQDKIRVNVIEISPNEKTIGSDIYKIDVMTDLVEAHEKIWDKVKRRIIREYQQYDFLF